MLTYQWRKVTVEVEGLPERVDDGIVDHSSAGHIPRRFTALRIDAAQCKAGVVVLGGDDEDEVHFDFRLEDGRLNARCFLLKHR